MCCGDSDGGGWVPEQQNRPMFCPNKGAPLWPSKAVTKFDARRATQSYEDGPSQHSTVGPPPPRTASRPPQPWPGTGTDRGGGGGWRSAWHAPVFYLSPQVLANSRPEIGWHNTPRVPERGQVVLIQSDPYRGGYTLV